MGWRCNKLLYCTRREIKRNNGNRSCRRCWQNCRNVRYIKCKFKIDHIGGVKELKERKGGKILAHRNTAENLLDPNISLTTYIGLEGLVIQVDSRVDDGDLIHLGNLEFRVIHTPGHTSGGSCLYCEEEKLLFSGDTLFRGTWGRTDVPTGNFEDVINSITKKLMILPDETIVYPGHGKSTMIREEKPIYLELKPRLL